MNELSILVKNVCKEVGGIGEANGDAAEETIYNILEKDKTFCGVKFDDIRKNFPVMLGIDTLTELDVLMVNGDTVSIIEIKHKVERKDINNLIHDKLTKFRRCYPQYDNYKIILGIGGFSFHKSAVTEASNNGIGIIKVRGEKIEEHTENIKMY